METKRNDYLVRKKFYRYLIPSFVSEVAMHAGYVIDAVIVGNLVGLDGLTVVTLANPVLQLLYIPGLILGLGGSTLAAVFLGERKIKEASDLLSACVIIGVLFSLAAGCVAFWISEPLSYILSADHPQLSPLLEDYLFVNILGLPVMSLSLLTCEFMSVDNNPDLGAYMFGIASVMDVVLDVVFIKFAGLGMTGAALGTIVGYACGLITLVYYARAKNRMLQMYWRGVAWMKNLLDALKTGTPRISLEVMQALQIFILNSAVLRILGPDGGADFHRIGKDAFGQVQEDFIHFHQRPLDGESFAGRKVQELAQVQQGKPEVVLRLHQGDAGLGAGGLLLRHIGLCGLAAGGHRLQAGDLRVVQFDLLAGHVYDFVIVKYLYISPCDGYADVVPGAFQVGRRRFQVQP